jgi:AGCS family alanine or glycine:cation symporter
MNGLMYTAVLINDSVQRIVWGPHLLILILGTGMYYSLRTDFLQIRKLPYILCSIVSSVLKKNKLNGKGTITQFQALTTALASTIGTGNIVGVATAIAVGGPGAVFWIWVSAFLGMMTKYSEILLSLKFRRRNAEGNVVGGPMYYISEGLGLKFLGVLFSFFGLLASFGIGNIAQINSIAVSFQNSFNIKPLFTGIVIAISISFIIVGGVSRISRTTEKLVPYMVIFYVVITSAVLLDNIGNIPYSFKMILSHAFTDTAAAGGFAGSTLMMTVRMGVARGIFANEAGLGSSPIAHAAADAREPAEQAVWGIAEVFIDTILICTCTALCIISTGAWNSGLYGVDLTICAFSSTMPVFAPYAISISIFFFAFSTLVSWSYYGERCIEFLAGSSRLNTFYKLVYSAVIVAGSVTDLSLVWQISDTLNGLMAFPNLIGVLALSGTVIKATDIYFNKK